MLNGMKPSCLSRRIVLVAIISFSGRSPVAQDADQAVAALRQTLDRFIAATDKGDTKTIAAMYDSAFTNVRVADDGGMVRLTREQLLQYLERATPNAFPTKETKIH